MSEPSRAWISADASGVSRSGRAVVDGAERDALVVDLGERVSQREDLEAAGVREDRPVPPRERVEAAELLDHVLARPEVEVVGVAEDHVRADGARTSAGSSVLTVPFVPTGMNAGVRISRRARSG